MCGIAGLVYEYNSSTAAKDWPALEEALQRLRNYAPDWNHPDPVFPLIEAVEEQLSDIREWPILSQLWSNPSRQEQLNQAAGRHGRIAPVRRSVATRLARQPEGVLRGLETDGDSGEHRPHGSARS